jgi:hypothetical protein
MSVRPHFLVFKPPLFSSFVFLWQLDWIAFPSLFEKGTHQVHVVSVSMKPSLLDPSLLSNINFIVRFAMYEFWGKIAIQTVLASQIYFTCTKGKCQYNSKFFLYVTLLLFTPKENEIAWAGYMTSTASDYLLLMDSLVLFKVVEKIIITKQFTSE